MLTARDDEIDRVVGLEGIVTTTIDPDDPDRRGRITAHGEIWGAVSESGSILTQGTHVRIVSVNGTRVVVTSIEAQAQPPPPPTTPPLPPAAPPST